MRKEEFIDSLFSLIDAEVDDFEQESKLKLIDDVLHHTPLDSHSQRLVKCDIQPFITGRRPIDEAFYPGLGSSDNLSFILSEDSDKNETFILYNLEALDPKLLPKVKLTLTLHFCGPDGSITTDPIPGWDERPISPQAFELNKSGEVTVKSVKPEELHKHKRLVFKILPKEFLPGSSWDWKDLDSKIKEGASNGKDPFTFGHLFTQKVIANLKAYYEDHLIASSSIWIDVFDTRRLGSLYKRIIDSLIIPDTQKQAEKAGVDDLSYAYHPLYPVLSIGTDKASLYSNALIEDVVYNKHLFVDQNWLTKVGLYLELLTCIGIFEAGKELFGDLLSKEERLAFENSPFYSEIRKRLNPRWRDVLAMHNIIFSKFGIPQTGPVSFLNLVQKRTATLAFLKIHHQDLQQAIELAGPNNYHAQETWHRVFRDAERAVMRKTVDAFPEIQFLSPKVRDFILWHEQGKLEIPSLKWVPSNFIKLLGDQDGLFASACNKYRESMNEVAEWAKHRQLMDYTGDECVPAKVSLVQAHLGGQKKLFERLQEYDGYLSNSPITIHDKVPDEIKNLSENAYELISHVPYFAMLSEEDQRYLARSARLIVLSPMERIVIQGRKGTSLFIVSDGNLEVIIRDAEKNETSVGTLKRGDIIGEMSLLTGEPRSATVRAIDGATVFEIGKQQYEAIVRSQPELVQKLAEIMESRVELNKKIKQEKNPKKTNYRQRIWHFFFPDVEI